ncbi:MAG: histidinol-phosphatase [Chloroherpetonaceae bacterium]|nr:histidinol-phosphatase [Chthonomonadaceae bacterium]MDW8209318.1 histidinol-phosphatase [Chloroherpetonaceae bacterium]
MDERMAWRVSLHGGHSGEFCDHAEGTLREILLAAVQAGYHTFGVSEHMPRGADRFLYPQEIALGWDMARIEADFARYAEILPVLVEELAGQLIVLRGFEAEVVPEANYAERIQRLRAWQMPDGTPRFDYCVGSVHYVHEIQLDGPVDAYLQAAEACGGIEALAIRYYETVAAMIETIRPEVVGHLDLIKRNLRAAGFEPEEIATPRVDAAMQNALEAARACGAILDLNTAGWRKGLGEPYPSPTIVRKASAMGVGFCFGDDSHRPTEVGAGVDAARIYLLQCGVQEVTVLTRESREPLAPVVRRRVSLQG